MKLVSTLFTVAGSILTAYGIVNPDLSVPAEVWRCTVLATGLTALVGVISSRNDR